MCNCRNSTGTLARGRRVISNVIGDVGVLHHHGGSASLAASGGVCCNAVSVVVGVCGGFSVDVFVDVLVLGGVAVGGGLYVSIHDLREKREEGGGKMNRGSQR